MSADTQIIQAKTFPVWSDELEGVFSPHFFLTQTFIKTGIPLKEVAHINPIREKPLFDDEENVPYVGLPETDDHQVKTILMRPYKEVRGRNVIKKGDILFARIEPSVFNKKYIYVDDLGGHDFAFTSTEFYIVEPKSSINPEFLFHMFFTSPVYEQVAGKTTGSTGRRRLDKGVFENIVIPYPSSTAQQEMANVMQSAYAEKRKKEAQAGEILDSINDFLMDKLGIKSQEEKEQTIFLVWNDEIDHRLDPMYFHPVRMDAVTALKESGLSLSELNQVAKFRKDIVNEIPEGMPYIGLENVVSNTGEYIENNGKESVSSAFVFKKGDVLFPKLRPYLNKVFYADFDGVCSTEFHVLQAKKVSSYFLFVFLSSSIVLAQTSRIMTGNTLPRLQTRDVNELLVPIIEENIQKMIAEKISEKRKKSQVLIAEGEELVNDAQERIEKMILGK